MLLQDIAGKWMKCTKYIIDMKTNFTKGNWNYVGGDDGSCEVNIGDTTAGICRWEKNTGVNVITREEMEANAKLIATAPELFEALIFCKSVIYKGGMLKRSEQIAFEIAESAINKATL